MKRNTIRTLFALVVLGVLQLSIGITTPMFNGSTSAQLGDGCRPFPECWDPFKLI